MELENFNRIIEALEVHYYKASIREVILPVQLNNTKEQKNVLVQSVAGTFYAGKENKLMKNGEFYFLPVDQPIYFKHGKSTNYRVFNNSAFTSVEEREMYLKPIEVTSKIKNGKSVFSIIGFEVLLYGAIPFFSILELPCVHIPYDEELTYLMRNIILEDAQSKIGSGALTHCLLNELVIHICRYIFLHPEYKKNLEKLNYLLDKRLITIIQYIQNNLGKDLSNEKIAEVAYVSRDYVGQFFKTLTGNNLQDYVENRRLEYAHFLLRTCNDNVQEIAHRVGFKDPAYFSRRFKLKFNENAKEIRKTGHYDI
ncbi:MAG TPA: AraC family transcriptional regulator [Bacteroidia bacterium]|nr:AraC family transcriptional regulator [Bacteroidia bacterium]